MSDVAARLRERAEEFRIVRDSDRVVVEWLFDGDEYAVLLDLLADCYEQMGDSSFCADPTFCAHCALLARVEELAT